MEDRYTFNDCGFQDIPKVLRGGYGWAKWQFYDPLIGEAVMAHLNETGREGG